MIFFRLVSTCFDFFRLFILCLIFRFFILCLIFGFFILCLIFGFFILCLIFGFDAPVGALPLSARVLYGATLYLKMRVCTLSDFRYFHYRNALWKHVNSHTRCGRRPPRFPSTIGQLVWRAAGAGKFFAI